MIIFLRKALVLFASLTILSAFGQKDQEEIKYDSIYSTNLGYSRKIKIFVPKEYFNQASKKFNVVYLLDGQSDRLFNLVISNFNYINGDLYNGYPPFIVVAVETDGKRSEEFTPPTNDETTRSNYIFKTYGYGNADNYLKFIREELFPYIDKNYSVTDHKVAIGHSLGGTALMHAMNSNKLMFDAYFLFSPNLEYGNKQLIRAFMDKDSGKSKSGKFLYISIGDDTNYESRFKEGVEELNSILSKSDLRGIKYRVDYISNCNHYESPQFSLPLVLAEYKKLYHPPSEDKLSEFLAGDMDFVSKIQEFYKEKMFFLNYLYYPSIDIINNEFAYFALNNDKPNEALEVINWGIELYPDNSFSYLLYLTKSEILEGKGEINKALNACRKGLTVLEAVKSKMHLEDYEYAVADMKKQLEYLENK